MTNEVLPIVRGLSWGFHRKPTFATQSQTSASLKRVRAKNAAYPRWSFELTWEYLKDNKSDTVAPADPYTDLEALLGFFIARGGSFESFRFRLADVTQRDSDSHVDGQLIGTGDGVTTNFQLVRSIGEGLERVQDVANLVVRVGGSVMTLGVDYTLGANGVISFVSPPAAAAQIDADFDSFYRVTFENDEMDVEDFAYQLYTLQSLSLVEDIQ